MTVTKLNANDWQAYKAMRLEALSQHGDVYGISLETEKSWSDQQWIDMLSDQRHAFFGLYHEGKLIGGGVVFTDRTDATGKTALLAGGYVQASHRRKGHSHGIYTKRLEWIKEQGRFDRIVVGHREGNEASRRANQAFGFKHIGTEEKIWGDQSRANIHIYEMRLR